MFDRQDILKACGPKAFQRGLNYWKADKVVDLEWEKTGEGSTLLGIVDGSGHNVYNQKITFFQYESSNIIIDGDCSCPVGYNCKHVAAALLQALKRTESKAPPPQDLTDTWLDQLKATTLASSPSGDERYRQSPYRLLYLLQAIPQDDHCHRLRVMPVKVRILKKGGYGKSSPYSMHSARYEFNASAFVFEADRDIARLLTSGSDPAFMGFGYKREESYVLERDFGELALRKMLSTDRCYWLNPEGQPLRLNTPREISFSWQAVKEGRKLSWQLNPPALIIQLEQLWYFDTEQLQCGLITHPGLLPKQASLLLEAPIIPEPQLEQISRKLILDFPEQNLPTPIEIDIEQVNIDDENPTIHLHLQSLESEEGGRRFHCAQLSFEYGNISLKQANLNATTQVVEGNTVYQITRNTALELEATEILAAKGLQPLHHPPGSDNLIWLWSASSASDAATKWHEFMIHDLPQLRETGWKATINDSFHLRFYEANEWQAELESDSADWFTLSLGIDLYGKKINLLPLLIDILSQAGDADVLREQLQTEPYIMAPADEHHWLKLPTARLLPVFDTLIELYDKEPLNKDGQLELSRLQSMQIGELLNDPTLHWHGAEQLQQLHQQLSNFQGIKPIATPNGFNAELRDYQQQGLAWIQFLREFEFNGILADDMGLGKTVQTLAHLLIEKQQGRMQQPCLIIAPTSLMGNWRREANRFTPELSVLVLHGLDRHAHFDKISQHDLILTTYPLLRRDKEQLLEQQFHYIILDEAQAIKNPKSQTAQVVYALQASHRLCLTGTPMENHLGELWSMFHFLMPGFLGNLERFNRLFRYPIERGNDDVRREQLQRRLKPFLLRRTKDAVAAELPEKTEIIRSVILEASQRDLYESIRLAMDKKLQQEINKKGLARSHIMILDALLKLRQVCCDPRLLSLPQAKKATQSAKLDLLMTMLPEMIEEGRKILIFSQFTKMLGLIEAELKKYHIRYAKLTGQTRKRDEVIDQFQDGNIPLFLISLKAGGVGLNLTAADTVIHYDPWWNPAAEDQATDRAHRIGQNKAVFVYKLITEDTVEDKILGMQKSKKKLAESIYSGKGGEKSSSITADELTTLLKPLD